MPSFGAFCYINCILRALTLRSLYGKVLPCRFFLMEHRLRGKTNREQGANP